MIVVEQPTLVTSDQDVTVVVAPQSYIVTDVGAEVSVVTKSTSVSVVPVENKMTVLPIQSGVTVVTGSGSGGGYDGPQIYVQATPPSGASLNDIWIRTA